MITILRSPDDQNGNGTGTGQNQNDGTQAEQKGITQEEQDKRYKGVRNKEAKRVHAEYAEALKELGIEAGDDPISAIRSLKKEIESEDDAEAKTLRSELDTLKKELASEKRSALLNGVFAGKVDNPSKVGKYFSLDYEIADNGKIKSRDTGKVLANDEGTPLTLEEAADFFLEENGELVKAETRKGVSGPQKGSQGIQAKTPQEFFGKALQNAFR